MNLRKLLSILLALSMLLTFAGCQFVEDPDEDTDDEVVGGGLIQARDGEETDDIEVEDPVEVVEPIPDTAVDPEDDTTAEPYEGEVDTVEEVDEEEVDDDVIFDQVETPDEDDVIAEEPIDEDIAQIELGDISEYTSEEGVSFYALVAGVGISLDEEGAGSLDVCALTNNDVNHKGLFYVEISPDTEILNFDGTTVESARIGDVVVITYDGEVLETYPTQIKTTASVTLVTHINRLAEIASYLPEGYESFGNYFPDWDNFEY